MALQDSLRKMRVGQDLVNSMVYEAANDLDAKDKRIAELEAALLEAESTLFNAASSASVLADMLKEAAMSAYKARDK